MMTFPQFLEAYGYMFDGLTVSQMYDRYDDYCYSVQMDAEDTRYITGGFYHGIYDI